MLAWDAAGVETGFVEDADTVCFGCGSNQFQEADNDYNFTPRRQQNKFDFRFCDIMPEIPHDL